MDPTRPRVEAGEEYLVVGGQELRLTHPDRVLYPATGTTKTDVISYYVGVAGAMLPHLAGRPATRKRWPDGVAGAGFYVKEVEAGIPVWLTRVQVPHRWGGDKFYPVLDTPAALAWLGQVSALEVHVPQWRIAPAGPQAADQGAVPLVDRVVFDLDPGEGAGLPECVDVAWALRERLGRLGVRSVPVTSGSKGLQVYVPMDEPITSGQASDWAQLAAEQLEQALPNLVVSTMPKSLRRGKVLIDWSQNNGFKTTIAPYSLRGRNRPTVAAPRTWDELTPGRTHLVRHLEMAEVLDRVTGGLDPLAALHDHPVSVDEPVRPRPAHTAASAVVVRERRPRPRAVVVGAGPRRPAEAMGLPADLAGPVQVALARAQDQVPGPRALPGGSRYEPKWDGFRQVSTSGSHGLRLWSKSGTDMTSRFPELASAATALVPSGTVLDGEALIWLDGRLRFELLQRRFTSARSRLAEEARRHPATYMVFDLLAVDGHDLRGYPWRTRRTLLEELARDWTPPLQLSPVTDDLEVARRWMVEYRPAGVEGLVAKGADSRYEPNSRRSWVKVKQRKTVEVLVGAVVGPLDAPTAFIAGLYQDDGLLRMVGRSTTLKRSQARALSALLTAAAADHPWPDTIAANRFGAQDHVVLTRVQPTVVVEVAADAAREYGIWRHGLRLVRHRPDMVVDELPRLAVHVDSA